MEKDSKSQKVIEQKELIYYDVLCNAWVKTKMEKDKILLLLSGAAIGLLSVLFITQQVTSVFIFWIFLIAILMFMISSIGLIVVFDKNTNYLEAIIEENEESKNSWDNFLKILDRVALYSFILGLVFCFIGTVYLGSNTGGPV